MENNNQQTTETLSVQSSQKRKFSCKYCFRELSSRQNLREHLYIHTGEKPYACTEPGCGQSFRQGSLLSIHRKIHSEVKKGRSAYIQVERVYKIPKLTDLILCHDDVHHPVELETIKQVKQDLSKDFDFLAKFIEITK
jgi:uncharacterized Zn-finger protein